MIATQIFSSVGIGLLIGILLGLSASPVVGLVVGSVTALLTSLIGMQTPKKSGDQETTEKISQEQLKLIGIRAGVFGLTCIVGIFAGIYMRTHNVLSPPKPTLKEQVNELIGIGFNSQEARDLVVVQVPYADSSSEKTNNRSTLSTDALQNTVLFSIDSETCEKIAISRFENISAAIGYYQTLELQPLRTIAMAVDKHVTEEKAKKEIMESVLELLCEKE